MKRKSEDETQYSPIRICEDSRRINLRRRIITAVPSRLALKSCRKMGGHMDYTNAFLGKTDEPTEADVAAALGSTAKLWNGFIQWMAEKQGITAQEWKGIVVRKYGWSMRLKQKARNIVYLGPGKGCFMVSFVLSDKALAQAKREDLPQAVQDVLSNAPRYPEGNGVRLIVHCAADLDPIRKIAAVKIAS